MKKVFIAVSLAAAFLVLAGNKVPKRHLIVCLDGVSFSEFQLMQKQGRFPYLRAPSRLISPFPSLTNSALVQILGPAGAPQSRGYEDSYYSWEKNGLVGGIRDRFKETFVKGTFREIFNYHPSGLESSFEYVMPPFSCAEMARIDFRRGLRKFERSKRSTFTLYLGPTDCVAHTGGIKSFRSVLRSVDAELEKFLKEHPDTAVTLFSDHGNEFGEFRRVDIGQALKERGYVVTSKIESDKSVVIPLYGLIGAILIYVPSGEKPHLARLVSHLEGVHFASWKNGSTVYLFTRGQEARIEQKAKTLAYFPGTADPLRLGAQPARSPQEWFDLTKAHEYPNSVNRVWYSSHDVVQNRASVTVDLEKGFYAGSKLLDFFVSLKATHGNLDREQSVGFAASSTHTFPSYLSTHNAWHYLSRAP